MITWEEAQKLVKEYLTGDDIILDEHTIEKTWGWVVIYTSQTYLETGDDSYCSLGDGPYIVSRRDGRVHTTGSAYSVEESIRQYEEQLDIIQDYTVIIEQAVPDEIGTIRWLADLLQLSEEEMRMSRTSVPRELLTGTWNDMFPIWDRLTDQGVEASIRSNYKQGYYPGSINHFRGF